MTFRPSASAAHFHNLRELLLLEQRHFNATTRAY